MKVFLFLLLFTHIIIGGLLIYITVYEQEIINDQVEILNKQHNGLITIGKTELSPFENFPKVSFKIYDVTIYEDKTKDSVQIAKLEDIYLSFNLLDIVTGNFDFKSLKLENGDLNIIFDELGITNIEKALTPFRKGIDNNEESDSKFNIHLKSIELKNIDIHKYDKATNTDVETYIYWANSSFKSKGDIIKTHLNSELKLNISKNGKQTYFHDKAFEIHSDALINNNTGIIEINPSWITMEHGDFNIEGSINTKQNMLLDLIVKGTKPSFDMFIAFAPHDLVPVLEKYQNEGNIYFNAKVKGETLHGKMPLINVNFGASKTYLENSTNHKKIEDLGFNGHFTNGEHKDLKSMAFTLNNLSAKLEEGNFNCSVSVKNFEEPDVKMNLHSEFNLEFLSKFLDLSDIDEMTGKISLDLNFHDIIDINHPEVFLNDLDQSYFSELKIEGLFINSNKLPKQIEDLNMHLLLRNDKANLNKLDFKIGKSDLSLSGYITNITSIIHNANKEVNANLSISSNTINLEELTEFSKETISNFKTNFLFTSSGKELNNFSYLPKGEFRIDNLFAQLKNYPHALHDFNVDVVNNNSDLLIKDFTGFIDDSDFHFNGNIKDYKFWFKDQFEGDVKFDISLKSNQLRLEDIFSYNGENYVPRDYRQEKFNNLNLHVNSAMHYKTSKLKSIQIELDRLDTKMKLHPLNFKNFSGKFYLENKNLQVNNFKGEIGKSSFIIDLDYFLGKNEKLKTKENKLDLFANHIDLDELMRYNLPSDKKEVKPKGKRRGFRKKRKQKHKEAFNIYELPFSNMAFNANVKHFINNSIDLQNIKAKLRTTKNHYIYVDQFEMNAAGGKANLSGYFNGSDPKDIHAKTSISTQNIDLDKLLLKFENFGQDHLVSENLHGKLNTTINGDIKIYPDMVPNIDESEIHMDLEVKDGRLENYEPMKLLSDYMGDKNLNSIKFNTLKNHIDIKDGKMTIPNMTIESTLGHMELSGTHDMNHNIEYFVRIPMKTVKKATSYKLFGGKEYDEEKAKEDEIIEVDKDKKTRYLNVKIHGTVEDYKIGLGKDK